APAPPAQPPLPPCDNDAAKADLAATHAKINQLRASLRALASGYAADLAMRDRLATSGTAQQVANLDNQLARELATIRSALAELGAAEQRLYALRLLGPCPPGAAVAKPATPAPPDSPSTPPRAAPRPAPLDDAPKVMPQPAPCPPEPEPAPVPGPAPAPAPATPKSAEQPKSTQPAPPAADNPGERQEIGLAPESCPPSPLLQGIFTNRTGVTAPSPALPRKEDTGQPEAQSDP
ncbi:MAG: hypothetical protein ACHP7N_05445, partial [Caulobacterales bacterium]